MFDAVDLFAGPGGWDVGARSLGLELVGYEFEPNACKTRRAAGFATVEGDVRNHCPGEYVTPGLIASPPCQTFSTAGKGEGRRHLDALIDAVRTGAQVDADDKTALVLEPRRWIDARYRAGYPYEWLAFEQVPAVLPIWQAYAEWLRGLGYWVSVGNLSAEQYGVPQTRKRAILAASLNGEAYLPSPTHSRPVGFAEALGLQGPWSLVSSANTGGQKGSRGIRRSPESASTVVGTGGWAHLVAGHVRAAGEDNVRSLGGRQITPSEGALLQSFPAEYPWQGPRRAVKQQIVNAIPPLMAAAILAQFAPTAELKAAA